MSSDVLFRPFRLKGLNLPNRIVMAPMTRAMANEGIVGEAQKAYYEKRAHADVGLILTEGTVVDRPSSRNLPGIPFFHGEQALAGWGEVVNSVHAAGGRIAPQLWHTGSTRAGPWEPSADVESPSGIVGPGEPRGKVMSEEDVADTIDAFAKAANAAEALGFDAIELHGAHGYLIDQFFWDGTNLRDDRWGGASIAERSRFAAEIVKAVRAKISSELPLILRLSQWKQQDYKARLADSPKTMEEWLVPLVDAGVDILHCSQRRFWVAEYPEVDGEEGLNFAGWAKKLTGAATISVGSVGLNSDFGGAFAGESSNVTPLDRLVDRMERDEFDLIAVGRALISDPLWVSKVRDNRLHELNGFNAEDLRQLA
jgi:2,4-dienoyl-CoA reductase-like NADH-dependent reductase (Old Yellow Enzyme family)